MVSLGIIIGIPNITLSAQLYKTPLAVRIAMTIRAIMADFPPGASLTKPSPVTNPTTDMGDLV